ncbi:LysR family transcriptional regulator [Xanthomonas sp. NCPPB 2632]|uniref:LysR family transcriptional regulator n=1 Tax=Xanthomonas sp. NCPPB 2632 TaxID=3240912 RepID=UPI0035187476
MDEPDLNLLIALDALLAEASVAGAARRLGLSASAMSRTLARLRAATGDELLVRAGRRMVPTPHAVALRELTRGLVEEARRALRPAVTEHDVAGLRRDFTLRANDGFVEVFAALLIADARRLAPGVRLRFASKAEKTPMHLREGLADLEVGVVGGMGPEVRTQALFRDRFVGVVRRGHPLDDGNQVTAGRYVAHGHVVASRRGQATGPVDTALSVAGLEREVVAVVPAFHAVLSVVRASDLVGLVPASFLATPPDGIAVFELPVVTPGITVSQMWHPRLDNDPGHRWLRQRVLALCREHLPD